MQVILYGIDGGSPNDILSAFCRNNGRGMRLIKEKLSPKQYKTFLSELQIIPLKHFRHILLKRNKSFPPRVFSNYQRTVICLVSIKKYTKTKMEEKIFV